MTKIQEWEKMIERVESHKASKEEIIRFLKNNQPKPKESQKKVKRNFHAYAEARRFRFGGT